MLGGRQQYTNGNLLTVHNTLSQRQGIFPLSVIKVEQGANYVRSRASRQGRIEKQATQAAAYGPAPQRVYFLGRFRRHIPIALTLMVRHPENFIIISPIMAPRPQNHPPFKSLNIYIYISILWVRCRPQRSIDCNKIWHKIQS